MKTKLKSILAVALCAVGFAAFAEPVDYSNYCLCGYINGADYACGEDSQNVGSYVFDSNGSLTATFVTTSYIYIRTKDAANWFMLESYDELYADKGSFTFKNTSSGASDRLGVNGGVALTFTLKDLGGGSLELSVALPKQTVSAVSAEGFLDLTVGDRVAAEPEELIVADPKWGNGKKAFVKIDGEDPAREYPELSIDKWFTSALTAGRYGMTFTSGETNETAVFWKTGDDWVVQDLPPSSGEGVFFESGKTHLILGSTTFVGDAPLEVEDGAKFEYGTGAGFKGGKLEAPRRYAKVDVEGGLYQIVEKIKGSKDNPWEVGVGVEAYTNGMDNLVIVGAGTIADLSEIPAGVKRGITAITVGDGVTDAAAGAFYGFDKVAVTLPDNWQGELPDDHGNWRGATNVERTRVPTAVKNVKVQQRYPWNGLVDVDFDLTGEGSAKVTVQVTVDGKKLKNPTVDGETTFDLGAGKELKDLRLTWDAKADFGDEEKHEKIKVKLMVEKAEAD